MTRATRQQGSLGDSGVANRVEDIRRGSIDNWALTAMCRPSLAVSQNWIGGKRGRVGAIWGHCTDHSGRDVPNAQSLRQ